MSGAAIRGTLRGVLVNRGKYPETGQGVLARRTGYEWSEGLNENDKGQRVISVPYHKVSPFRPHGQWDHRGRYIPRGDEVPDVIEVELKPGLMRLKLVLNVTQRTGNWPRFSVNWPQVNYNDKGNLSQERGTV